MMKISSKRLEDEEKHECHNCERHKKIEFCHHDNGDGLNKLYRGRVKGWTFNFFKIIKI